MDWWGVAAYWVIIGGLAVVTLGAVRHANKSSRDKPSKPAS